MMNSSSNDTSITNRCDSCDAGQCSEKDDCCKYHEEQASTVECCINDNDTKYHVAVSVPSLFCANSQYDNEVEVGASLVSLGQFVPTIANKDTIIETGAEVFNTNDCCHESNIESLFDRKGCPEQTVSSESIIKKEVTPKQKSSCLLESGAERGNETLKNVASISKCKQTGMLRRGKWTAEEEAYVGRVIQDFNSGYLDAPAGTTLRTYLSEKLKCDPMRITKKFTGESCIGKRVFHPVIRTVSNAAIIDKAQADLDMLERRWRRRLEIQQRESVKKAAASVAVVAVASGDQIIFGPNSMRADVSQRSETSTEVIGYQITKTASWLDRAKSLLNEPSEDCTAEEHSRELENQIQEVQRLIHEGPSIQKTCHTLPQILDSTEDIAIGVDNDVNDVSCIEEEPADKRLRTAEDAEALVGFLLSVRASAAQAGMI